ncbi:hypothetical protein FSP39_022356 [Pinctada imbricata]|uniref:DNA polymerase theta n=1 Tax=Pinctada imbricata TaxID=66713 RepID=A0AA89C7Z6_PINIB|nr:hypothetical protein FSP39_022356 [Pinctada imbricata]
MFPWQAECLCTAQGKVLGENINITGGNLVYSAPTSAGKTMVAELLVLKRVMETKRKAIIILPFVSVAREKMFYLQQMYQDAGVRVGGFMGSYSPAGGFSGVDVAVCTIEKGNSLINRLLEENRLAELGIIVVDELHLVGDSHRGYLLELLLTKIRYVMKKEEKNIKGKDREQLDVPDHNVQVVGMSATLPNLDLLAKWLNAELYHTDFRPVPLTECVKIGTSLYDSSLIKIRDVDLTLTFKNDEDHVIPLCLEMLKDGHSTLIFCPTKNWCEKLCETVARELYGLLRLTGMKQSDNQQKMENDQALEIARSLPLNRQALLDAVEQLRRTPVGLDSMLGKTIPYGVAFHHAGLTFDERDIVEGAFRQGILKVLVATSTLSSGVNLPARRVIVRSPTFHGKIVDFLTYKQMIGRAGRKGVDTEGESVLICKPNERAKAVTLVTSELPSVGSCLYHKEGEPLSRSLKRAILEIVVSGVASVPEDVAMYASCTMLAASLTKDTGQTDTLINACIEFLRENEFVSLQKVRESDGSEVERFCPTQLGSAVLASALSPDEGLTVFAELEKARQCFVLENELHIIYLVTPIYGMDLGGEMDWYQFYYQWEKLTIGQRRVAELVGVSEGFITKAIRGRIPTKTHAQMRTLAIHKRFWTALMLHDLVQEMPLNEVARKYNCNKGQLQSLQQSSATFAGMVTVFCRRLGWCNLELILGQFQNRLTFGIQRELCDLVRLTLLNGQRARVLNKRQDNESEWEANQRRESRCMWLTGRKGVTELEAAVAVIEEAKGLIQDELGGLGIQWKNSAADDKTKDESVLDADVSSNANRTRFGASQTQNKSTLSSRSILIGPVKRSGSASARKSGKRLSSGRKSKSPHTSSLVASPEEGRSKRGGTEDCLIVSPPNLRIKQQKSSKKEIPTNICVTLRKDQENNEVKNNASFIGKQRCDIQDSQILVPENSDEDRNAVRKDKAEGTNELLNSSKADVQVHTVVADVHVSIPQNVRKRGEEKVHASKCSTSGDLEQVADIHTLGSDNVQTSGHVHEQQTVCSGVHESADVHKDAQKSVDVHKEILQEPENCAHTEDIFGDSMDEAMDMTIENVGEIHTRSNVEENSAKSNCNQGMGRNCDKIDVNGEVKKHLC